MGNEHLEHLSREELMDLINIYSNVRGYYYQRVNQIR